MGDETEETTKAVRERSTIQFPYNDLDDAVEVATKIWDPYGGEADVAQVAAALGQRPASGAFRTKILAAKMFGLVQGSQTLVLTPLGRHAVNEPNSAAARAEAFLKVPLYKAIFDEVSPQGGMIPNTPGLGTMVRRLGVVTNQVDTAVSTFKRSARQAGYFAHGEDRLVRPAAKLRVGADDAPKDFGDDRKKVDHDGQNKTVETHPLMVGLLQSLPALGASFPAKERDRWLNAVRVNFDFMYGPAEDDKDPLADDLGLADSLEYGEAFNAS